MSEQDKTLRGLKVSNIEDVYRQIGPTNEDRRGLLSLAAGMYVAGFIILYLALSSPEVYNRVTQITNQIGTYLQHFLR
ncbi:MAG: hypothetical protein N3D75_02545 [Candidatus Aenigmarchaeota archaeon]|nr:hypothetical protein [Candidatus Aenigmarchaeota archaeon]